MSRNLGLVTLDQFNEVMFKTQLLNSCFDITAESIEAKLAAKETPGRLKRILRMVRRDRLYTETKFHDYLKCFVQRKATWGDLAEFITEPDDRQQFFAALKRV
jgi:hypothetical protein